MDVWFSIEEEPPPRGAKAIWRDLKTFVSAPPERVRRAFALLTRTYHGGRQTGSYHRTERCAARVRYPIRREPSVGSRRDFIVYSHRMARIVLSEGLATCRLPQLQRARLWGIGSTVRGSSSAADGTATFTRTGGRKRERRSAISQAPPLLLQRKPYLTGSPPSRQVRPCRQEGRVGRR